MNANIIRLIFFIKSSMTSKVRKGHLTYRYGLANAINNNLRLKIRVLFGVNL